MAFDLLNKLTTTTRGQTYHCDKAGPNSLPGVGKKSSESVSHMSDDILPPDFLVPGLLARRRPYHLRIRAEKALQQ